MKSILLRNARAVNRGRIFETDIFIKNGRIEQLAGEINRPADIEFDLAGKTVIPGIIDDQVHFREPGLTHKADIFSESRAAVAGGTTSFMEMPNTNPTTTTQEKLAEKFAIAARTSLANHSFFFGATNDNLDEVLKTDPRTVCGIKAFMGSSTGNMLVDDPSTLENLFSRCPMLIATHCEDEATVRANTQFFVEKYGDKLTAADHPKIRSAAACLRSSSLAVGLAKKHGTRLHILHISTADELGLFQNDLPLAQKRITSEVCVHHLFFNSRNYPRLGNLIKCNPAIKSPAHQSALFPALLDDRLDIIATDHAPHTFAEKSQAYINAPSGLPLVQHSLNLMLGFYWKGQVSLEKIVEKMCHAPAVCFKIKDRGFLDEGHWADLAIIDLDKKWTVAPENILYKCGWSPLDGKTMRGRVETTIVSGHIAWHEGRFYADKMGERLLFF